MIDLNPLKRRKATALIAARIDPETKQALEAICSKDAVSMSSVVTALITAFIKDYKGADK